MAKRVRVGLAGSGFVADSSHMPSYREIESAEIVAVSGRNQNRTEQFARRWSIENAYYGESAVEKMCRDPGIDLIDVCLPNDLHLRAIELAAENHKDIICEKPLGRNREEAERGLFESISSFLVR
jgi:predicted dehydrogenase